VQALGLMAGGALFPDIDHPQSAMGRVLFFLSIPLNRYVGHRRTFHGFFLWSLVAVAGIFWMPLFWIGLGALSHVFIDALNVSGVQALMPFSEKVCVLFPEQAEFLRVRLRVSDEKWQTLAMNGWARTRRELSFYDGEEWKHGPAGAIVFGYIVARELELETGDREVMREKVSGPAEDDGRDVAVADILK
jgi:hypothetical protein